MWVGYDSDVSISPEQSRRHMEENYDQRILNMRRLRTLLRKRRTNLVPEALAGFICHRVPDIYSPEAEEIVEILSGLIQEIREEFSAAGILSTQEERTGQRSSPKQRLTARERSHVADFSALVIWTSLAFSYIALSPGRSPNEQQEARESTIALAREGVEWGRIAEDSPQLAVAMLNLASHLDRFHNLSNTSDEACDLYRTAIDLLENEKGSDVESIRLSLYYCLGAALELKGKFEEGMEVLEQGKSLVAPGATQEERAMRVNFLALQSNIARKQKIYQKALDLGHQALRWSDPTYDPTSHCKLLQSLGLLYNEIEHYEEGLKYLLEAINLLETHGLSKTGIWVYFTTAEHYNKRGDISHGHEILDRAESILGYSSNYLPSVPDRFLISLHICRAQLLVTEGKYVEAEKLLEWLIEKSRELGLPLTTVSAYGLAAKACGARGDYRKACECLEQAIASSHASSRISQLRLHINLAEWRIANEEYSTAANLLDMVEPELKEIQPQRPYIQLLQLQARLCEQQDNLQESLRLERQASELERELLENNRERSIRYARIQAETTVLERMVEREKEEKQRLEHELTGAVIELGEKERLIDEAISLLKSELTGSGSGRRKNPEERTSLARVYSILSVLQKGEKGSAPLLAYLNNTGDEFLRQLRIIYPNLTTSQERLCSLLRSGLSAGEICTLLDIGSEALKARRKRLRKVFELNRGESLEKFLSDIGEEE